MDISSVSSAFSSSSSAGSTAALEKQKAALEKKITDEQASKDDDKVKALKVAQYKQQIAQIDADIKAQQAKANKENSTGKGGASSSVSVSDIASASSPTASALDEQV